MNVDLLECLGKGCGYCMQVVTSAGITATSVAMQLAVKLSICHKITTMICELITPTIKTITPQSLKEALIIHLIWKVKLERTAANDTALLYSIQLIWF